MAVLNGRLPLSSLTHIGTDHYGRAAYLTTDAAASWARMRRAGMPFDISDAYRNYARQKQYEANPPNSVGLAAPAGTSSHGWGLAVDARGATLTWLTRHGAAHGWVRTIAREPWHFEYKINLDKHRNMKENSMSDYMTTPQPGLTNPASGKQNSGEDALQISQHYVYRNYGLLVHLRTAVAALSAQVTNLIGAVAAQNRGEPFDEAKFLAGVDRTVREAVQETVGDSIDLDVVVTPRKN